MKLAFIGRVLITVGVLLAILFLRAPRSAYAHFPASDGEIAAVLHVEPDDPPVPGSPEKLYLILSDLTNRFQITKCDCNLSVSYQQKPLLYVPLTPPPADKSTVYSTSAVPLTFPAQGIYRILAAGQPLDGKAFQPFSLAWNLQVAQTPKSTHDFSASTFLIYFGLILGVFLLVGITLFMLT